MSEESWWSAGTLVDSACYSCQSNTPTAPTGRSRALESMTEAKHSIVTHALSLSLSVCQQLMKISSELWIDNAPLSLIDWGQHHSLGDHKSVEIAETDRWSETSASSCKFLLLKSLEYWGILMISLESPRILQEVWASFRDINQSINLIQPCKLPGHIYIRHQSGKAGIEGQNTSHIKFHQTFSSLSSILYLITGIYFPVSTQFPRSVSACQVRQEKVC